MLRGGAMSITLLLTCKSCGKKYKITKYATPPSDGMKDPEPEKEVVVNIINTAGFEHYASDRCSGSFFTKRI
jgi:hypothetical protein